MIFKVEPTLWWKGGNSITLRPCLVLLICIPVAYYANGFVSVFSNEIIGSISFLLILLIPLLYFSNWDYSLFFQKPTKNELILAVLMCLAYIVYSSILTNLLGTWGIPDVGNSNANIVTIVSLIFSMMAEELIKFIKDSDTIKNVICLPKTGEYIESGLVGSDKNVKLVQKLDEAVNIAKKVSKEGTICLLSPAASSYGYFKNFEERGRLFKKFVLENN